MMEDPLPLPPQPLTTGSTILLVVLCAIALGHALWLARLSFRNVTPALAQAVGSVAGSVFLLVTTGAYWDELATQYPVIIGIMVVACLSMMGVVRMALGALDQR
jgi:hypothetical protein